MTIKVLMNYTPPHENPAAKQTTQSIDSNNNDEFTDCPEIFLDSDDEEKLNTD